ncbi:tRNA (guanine(46)-N(7))-methyltransferase TrmB [Echinimonas agarilytica]|uniref:tRNA (guanine(46)-N(7))-methyltransferase n=1 Tax=Echinimonas agarilytica TaxID=1215918 RepID=A0AA42B6P2_9GAMM|nr:hypothetical protein [Echinimonas agarilytica]MCM2678746.1 hypothetical protein [Echinimonas agarilytica]
MSGDSKPIVSNQEGCHDGLLKRLERHLAHPFKKPIAEHTRQAFDEVNEQVKQWTGPIILDACCGVGESTKGLAEAHPDALVVGIDKSDLRIGKGLQESGQGRYILMRADLNDFWRLAWSAGWNVAAQYVLYPNPWPKSEHLGRRWHGAGVFPYILALGGELIVRSNWDIYINEFAQALSACHINAAISRYPEAGETIAPMTPFERKYWQSGHSSVQVTCSLDSYQAPDWLAAAFLESIQGK